MRHAHNWLYQIASKSLLKNPLFFFQIKSLYSVDLEKTSTSLVRLQKVNTKHLVELVDPISARYCRRLLTYTRIIVQGKNSR